MGKTKSKKVPGNQSKPITIFGEVFPSRLAAAEHYKINLRTFRGRLRKGWTPEDAVTKTVASDVTIEVDGMFFSVNSSSRHTLQS